MLNWKKKQNANQRQDNNSSRRSFAGYTKSGIHSHTYSALATPDFHYNYLSRVFFITVSTVSIDSAQISSKKFAHDACTSQDQIYFVIVGYVSLNKIFLN